MSLKIFVEGGGDSKEQIVRCREDFRKLIEKAGFARPKSPSIVLCRGRGRAYDKFRTEVKVGGEYAILLVDSGFAQKPCPAKKVGRPHKNHSL